MSVPPGWATATPAIRLAASVLQGTGSAAAPVVAADGAGTLFSQIGMASLAGGALGGAAPRAVAASSARGKAAAKGDDQKTAGSQENGSDKPKDDKKDGTQADKLKRVLADLSEKPESVQHWHTDKAHLETLLAESSTKPGVHAVHVSPRSKANTFVPRPIWG